MFSFNWLPASTKKNTDITNYVEKATWSGDLDSAARKLEISIACNHKDKSFINQNVTIGDTIQLAYTDETATKTQTFQIFEGTVFNRSRNTANSTYDLTIYDKMIYLAKSKTTRKFSNITVDNIIKQVANDFGLAIGSITEISVYCDFIADNMSYTEILKKAFSLAYAKNGKKYHYFISDNKLNVIERSQIITGFLASDSTNVQSSTHSESIEDMVNSIMIVDANGSEIGRVNNDDDLNAYGKIQEVYKVDEKQDTQTAAKAMLKRVSYKSSLSCLGNIQCISGYAITIQEEQLKGLFTIISDRHSIDNNVHKMDLDLEFLKVI